MAKRLRHQRIRTTFDTTCQHDTVCFGGSLDGRATYLMLTDGYRCMGKLSGQSLYRLAKAIVRHFEEDQES